MGTHTSENGATLCVLGPRVTPAWPSEWPSEAHTCMGKSKGATGHTTKEKNGKNGENKIKRPRVNKSNNKLIIVIITSIMMIIKATNLLVAAS